jgi:hypothetical protein
MLTWLPFDALASAGIKPERTRELERRDGSIFTRSTVPALLHVASRSTIDDIIFCEAGDEPKIGWRALSGLNLRVDDNGHLVDSGPIPAAMAISNV